MEPIRPPRITRITWISLISFLPIRWVRETRVEHPLKLHEEVTADPHG